MKGFVRFHLDPDLIPIMALVQLHPFNVAWIRWDMLEEWFRVLWLLDELFPSEPS